MPPSSLPAGINGTGATTWNVCNTGPPRKCGRVRIEGPERGGRSRTRLFAGSAQRGQHGDRNPQREGEIPDRRRATRSGAFAQQGVVVRVAPEKAAWHGPNRGSDLCVSRRVRGDKLSGGSRGIPEELQLDELVDEASGDPRSDPGELDVLRCRCYQRQSSVTNGPTRAPSLATARHAGPPRGHRSAALTAKCLQLNQGQCLEASLAWANRTVTKLPR